MKNKIRKAKNNETKVLTELAMESKAYWGYSDEFMHNCREELSIRKNKIINPLFHYQVAEEYNQILGFWPSDLIAV